MMQKLIDFAIKNPVLEIIDLEVRSDNLHAIRLYESFGFRTVGIMPKQMKIEGKYHDTNVMIKEVKHDD